nr:integrase, catalytic region, zinc finger, CCHC-type, peptidase aspartic, catalytic [Tanacetum cinerariifolium]
MFKTVGHIWKPTGRTFKLVGNVCPLNRIATPTIVPPREPIPIVNSIDKPVVTMVYTRKPKATNKKVPNKLEPNNSWGSSSSNVPSSLLTCRLSKSSSDNGLWRLSDWESDHFSDGVDLLTGSRGNNLYTLSLQDMMVSSPICLLSNASKTKSWLWHRRLSHLNFSAINYLARQGLVRALSKLKFKKDHLCSACAIGKSTKKTHKPKSEDTNQEKLYLLHMDLCGPMRVESVNGKKYIVIIVDDYSRFTWVKFLRSKDETPTFIIKFLKMIQIMALDLTKFQCIATIKVLLLYDAIMSNTLGLSTSTSDIISSKSRLRMGYFVNTEYQLADLFTKALGRDRIEFLTTKLGMRSFTPETLKQLRNKEDE